MAGSLLALVFTSAPVAASHDREDVLPFQLGLPLPDEPECDEPGLFAVKFCDSVGDYDMVTIEVRSNLTLDLPVGGTWKIIGTNGNVVREGDFCDRTTLILPSYASGLVVDVASLSSITSGALEGPLCGVAPFAGEVWLYWSEIDHHPILERDDDDDKCICECDCCGH